MSHAKLFGIVVRHGYYSDGLCADFALAPTGETEKLLRNHRCVVKPMAYGADIYVETEEDGKPKIAFGQDATLSFELRLKTPELPLFTDATLPQENSDFQISYRSRLTDGFFAKVDIKRDFNQTDTANVEIGFSAKKIHWVYFLITDQGGLDKDFSIASPPSQKITWKPLDATDRISQKLTGQYPSMRCLPFASEQPIPCRESGLRHVQLLFGGNTIIESLPNPSWRDYFQTEIVAGGGNVDAIFQVVKYLTNTTLTKV